MNRTLGFVALAGLTIGVVCLSLAWAIGGKDLRQAWEERRHGRHFIVERERDRDREHYRVRFDDDPACDNSKVHASVSERHLAWTGDDAFNAALTVPLRLLPGSGSDVVLRGAPEVIAHLVIEGSHLRADCRSLTSRQAVTVEVPARALRTVRLSGAIAATLDKLDQASLALVLSGSGRVDVHGTVERVSATISGSGDLRLNDVALKRLSTTISGSGGLEAGPTDEADITLSGSGRVRLLTRPAHLSSKISGSGRIVQAETADKK